MREHLHVNHRLGHSLSTHRCSRGFSSRVPIDQLRRCRGLGRMKTARISVTIERELAFLPMLGYKQSALERGSRRYLRLYINHNKQENLQARMIHCSPFPPPTDGPNARIPLSCSDGHLHACIIDPHTASSPYHHTSDTHATRGSRSTKKDCIKHDFVYPCPTP